MRMDAKLKRLYSQSQEPTDQDLASVYGDQDCQDSSIRYKSNIVLSLLFHHHFTRLNDLKNRIQSSSSSTNNHHSQPSKHNNIHPKSKVTMNNGGCGSCDGVCKSAQSPLSSAYNMDEDEFKLFNDLCKTYDPETEFLLLASIRVNPDDIGDNLQPRKPAHSANNSLYVLKFIKLKLLNENDKHLKKEKKLSPYSSLTRKLGFFHTSSSHESKSSNLAAANGSFSARSKRTSLVEPTTSSQARPPKDVPLTLILTSLKRTPTTADQLGDEDDSNMNMSKQHDDMLSSATSYYPETNRTAAATTSDTNEDRQLFLANLLSEFDMRGINLRHKYPKIYRDLCLYVEENRPFTPVCLFPRDLTRNNLFMCLIMPNSEPTNYSWLYDNDDFDTTGTGSGHQSFCQIGDRKNIFTRLY